MKNETYKVLVMLLMSTITALMSLLVYIGSNVLAQNTDILIRLRTVEINQAVLMERLGVKPKASSADIVRELSKKTAILNRSKNQPNQNLLTSNAYGCIIADNKCSFERGKYGFVWAYQVAIRRGERRNRCGASEAFGACDKVYQVPGQLYMDRDLAHFYCLGF